MQHLTPVPTTLPKLLTVEQTAVYLDKTIGTVARLARAGRLPAVKIGGTWRISEAALADMLNRRA